MTNFQKFHLLQRAKTVSLFCWASCFIRDKNCDVKNTTRIRKILRGANWNTFEYCWNITPSARRRNEKFTCIKPTANYNNLKHSNKALRLDSSQHLQQQSVSRQTQNITSTILCRARPVLGLVLFQEVLNIVTADASLANNTTGFFMSTSSYA